MPRSLGPMSLYDACLRDAETRHKARLACVEKMRAQMRLLDADPLPFAWRQEHLALPPLERQVFAREALYRKASQFTWDVRNRCLRIEGFDLTNYPTMTQLYERLLAHGYKEVSRESGVFVDVVVKKGRLRLSMMLGLPASQESTATQKG